MALDCALAAHFKTPTIFTLKYLRLTRARLPLGTVLFHVAVGSFMRSVNQALIYTLLRLVGRL